VFLTNEKIKNKLIAYTVEYDKLSSKHSHDDNLLNQAVNRSKRHIIREKYLADKKINTFFN